MKAPLITCMYMSKMNEPFDLPLHPKSAAGANAACGMSPVQSKCLVTTTSSLKRNDLHPASTLTVRLLPWFKRFFASAVESSIQSTFRAAIRCSLRNYSIHISLLACISHIVSIQCQGKVQIIKMHPAVTLHLVNANGKHAEPLVFHDSSAREISHARL